VFASVKVLFSNVATAKVDVVGLPFTRIREAVLVDELRFPNTNE
jgi:hypothetical protein